MTAPKPEHWQEIARELGGRLSLPYSMLEMAACKRIAELEAALAKEKECSDRLLSQLNAALRDAADLHEALAKEKARADARADRLKRVAEVLAMQPHEHSAHGLAREIYDVLMERGDG